MTKRAPSGIEFGPTITLAPRLLAFAVDASRSAVFRVVRCQLDPGKCVRRVRCALSHESSVNTEDTKQIEAHEDRIPNTRYFVTFDLFVAFVF